MSTIILQKLSTMTLQTENSMLSLWKELWGEDCANTDRIPPEKLGNPPFHSFDKAKEEDSDDTR